LANLVTLTAGAIPPTSSVTMLGETKARGAKRSYLPLAFALPLGDLCERLNAFRTKILNPVASFGDCRKERVSLAPACLRARSRRVQNAFDCDVVRWDPRYGYDSKCRRLGLFIMRGCRQEAYLNCVRPDDDPVDRLRDQVAIRHKD
jgi:hypothetical protein